MHMNVQILVVRCAGHAEKSRDPQPEQKIVSLFSLLVEMHRDW
jgi:hypothetical protein